MTIPAQPSPMPSTDDSLAPRDPAGPVAARRLERPALSMLVPIVTLASLGVIAAACGDYPVASVENRATASGGSNAGTGGSDAGTGGSLPVGDAPLPCKLLLDAGHECVSAHSSVRLLRPEYTGPLYQLEKDGMTQDVGTVDGYADVTTHTTFCGLTGCTIKILYDQSGYGNHMTTAPKGSAKPTPGNPINANGLPVMINGRSAYGMLFRPGQGYRAACKECQYPAEYPSGVPVGDAPQTTYMVTSQEDLIDGCCFDYGNASTSANNDGNGTMETVYFGMGVIWGTGSGDGPWVMADMENGLFPGWENNSFHNISTNTPLKHDFVTAVVVGDTQDKNGGKGRFALYGGDATTPEIKEMYDGIRPERLGYVPMQKQGSVILGIGGDNSDGDGGRFYEGVIALGAAPATVVQSLSAAIAQAGYGR